MSRIGKNPVPIPAGVETVIDGLHVRVSGPKGALEATMPVGVAIRPEEGEIVVERKGDSPIERSRHGLVRSLIKGSDIELQVGFSHPVLIEAPAGIDFEVSAPTKIGVSGIDKQLVGQIAADIRKVRPPEPYKGKGIRYEGEVVRRKAGKAAGR
jgi:large subunit ribosomal protein L6